MPTYPSPVTVSDFKLYVNDQSADPTVLAYFQSLLDTATERVYTYLDADFTPSALKTKTFLGNNSNCVRLHEPAAAITAWETRDETGTLTPQSTSSLHLFQNGYLVVLSDATFLPDLEHRISYTLPSTLVCPETVKQVITEVAAIMLRESKQGAGTLGEQMELFKDSDTLSRSLYVELADRHRMMLSPYKRYGV